MRWTPLLATTLCFTATACADKPVPPFASMPFSVARDGNVVSIPFAVPATANLSYRYMLAFKYTRPADGDPLMLLVGTPQSVHIFMKVSLVFLHPSGEEETVRLASHCCYDSIAEAITTHNPHVFNVVMSGMRMNTAYMEVVNFTAPRHGNYRFDVETVGDMTLFEPIVSWLTVEREYRHHK